MTKNVMIKTGIVVGIVAGVVLFGLQYLVQHGQEFQQRMTAERAEERAEAEGREKQEQQAAKVQIMQFEVALDAFEIDVGRYPTTTEGLNALIKKPASDADGWQQPYMRGIPQDPWGKPYVYENSGGSYVLYSCGPDRKAGTSDDIAND